jgi:hypothetical protein
MGAEGNLFPKISVNALIDVHIIYKVDLYDLACILLRINDTRSSPSGTTKRTTVKGLASKGFVE